MLPALRRRRPAPTAGGLVVAAEGRAASAVAPERCCGGPQRAPRCSRGAAARTGLQPRGRCAAALQQEEAKAAATPRREGEERGRAERARAGQTHGMAPRARGRRHEVRRSRLAGWGGGERERMQAAGVAPAKAGRPRPPARRVANDGLGARRRNNHTAGYRINRRKSLPEVRGQRRHFSWRKAEGA